MSANTLINIEQGGSMMNIGNGATVTLEPGASIYVTNASGITVSNVGGNLIFDNLPTSDPSTEGALWSDSGTLKISSGG